jgi:hypothetical protein
MFDIESKWDQRKEGIILAEELLYLHFGRQCPGTFFSEQASRAAELLQLPYREVDISQRPDLAERYNLFLPGAVVIGEFRLDFPGQAEEMVESYRRQGPLLGKHDYQAMPPGQVERVEELRAQNCACAFRSCLRQLTADQGQRKAEWLGKVIDDGFAGLIGWQGDEVVGFVELLPETAIPYPLGVKRSQYGFITCLYSPIDWGLQNDYRTSLLTHLFVHAKEHGYRGLSVIAGLETPYPNGPIAVFDQLGFQRVKYMGKVMLRYRWEDAWLLQKQLED